ncbi:MAG: hypothetical protein KC656_36345, partial [Myxococcales bacterium]|nr:hypothetical protein [Myxococcales bacterium]
MAPPPDVARGLDLGAFFDVPTHADWEAAATKLLKGRPLDSLTTTLPEGFACPPLFTATDAVSEPGLPDQAPYLRGSGVLDRRAAGWDVRVGVDAGSLKDGRAQVAAALAGGARSVWLVPDGIGRGLGDRTGLPLRCEGCLDTVLGDAALAETP